MRNVVEVYVGIWILMVLFLLGVAFTSVNMNITQARKIYNDIRAEVQASNGYFVPDDSNRFYYSSWDVGNDTATLERDGYQFEYSVIRLSNDVASERSADDTFIYNNLYKISLRYVYVVPLFGRQVYPLTGYAF